MRRAEREAGCYEVDEIIGGKIIDGVPHVVTRWLHWGPVSAEPWHCFVEADNGEVVYLPLLRDFMQELADNSTDDAVAKRYVWVSFPFCVCGFCFLFSLCRAMLRGRSFTVGRVCFVFHLWPFGVAVGLH